MATLTVGKDKQFSTIAAAVAASRDGDLLAVDAGTYTNDFASIDTKITLQGTGGMAKMVATVAPPNGKGILLANTDITIDRFEFSGAAVPDNNGAGIRYQGGDLTITNSFFHDNQNGLLANPVPDGSITIRNSEFSRNGNGDGYTHNLYVGEIARLDISDSYFHDALVGHQIKSRAYVTTITDSRIADGENGTGSYSIDLPNGGVAVIRDNVIEQGANSDNPTIISYGVEGNVRATSSLEIRDNIILNDLASPSARLLWNTTSVDALVADNRVLGLAPEQYASGPAIITGMKTLANDPGVDTSAPWSSNRPDKPVPAPTPAPELSPEPGPEPGPELGPEPGPVAPLPTLPEAAPVPEPVAGGVALSIKLSADSWQGDPVAVVSVNGKVAFNGAISAPQATGGQVVELGNFDGSQPHAVSVQFTNDAWDGSADTDRNLYVENILVNGVGTGQSQALFAEGGVSFTVDAAARPVAEPAPAQVPIFVEAPTERGRGAILTDGAAADRLVFGSEAGGNASPELQPAEEATISPAADPAQLSGFEGAVAEGLAAEAGLPITGFQEMALRPSDVVFS